MAKKFVTLFGLATLIAGFSLFIVGCGSKTEDPPPGSVNTGAPVDASGEAIPKEEAGMDGPTKGKAKGGGP